MSALFLPTALVVAFAFGYRFYAKLLALDIFRLDANYSTRAESRPDGRDYVPTHRHLLFGHHLAAVTGAATFAAPVVAAAWGWIPVFLWITIGSAVAAGTYGLGNFWLASRHPEGFGQLTSTVIGRRARAALLLLAIAALVIVIATFAGLAATMLAAYPAAVLPLAAIALIAWAFGSFLHGRAEFELLPVSVIAFALSLVSIYLLGRLPLAFNGALTITFDNVEWISIDAVVVWVVLLFVYAFHSARLPVWKLARPRGFLTSLLLLVLLILFFVALIARHPTLAAPEFNTPPATASPLPWLFLVVGSGALAGWQLLIVRGVTGRELRRETDARYVGYGVALLEGVAALSGLLIAASAFGARDAWIAYYAKTPSVADFPRAAMFYVDQFARQVGALGLDAEAARYFAATVLAGLSVAALETAVRALKNLFVEIAPPQPAAVGRRDGERTRLALAIAAGAVLALHDGRGLGGLTAWPLLALISLWLAAGGFGLTALALRRMQRPSALVAALGACVAVLALWASAVQLWAWWEVESWAGLATGGLMLVLAALLMQETIDTARRATPPDAERA